MRFQVLTAVKMSLSVFWVVKACGLAGTYQHFGETSSVLKMQAVIFLQNVGMY
jgi:hypothetical protein